MVQNLTSTADKEFIQKLAEKIKQKFHPQKIILFGSYGYGKPDKGSDIDLFIIMKMDIRPYKQASLIRLFIDETFEISRPMDIIVRDPNEVEQRLKAGDFFIRTVLEKGVPL